MSPRQCKACDKELRTRDKVRIARSMRRYAESNPYRVWATGTIRNHVKKGFRLLFTSAELAFWAAKTPDCEICGCPLNYAFGTKAGLSVPRSPTMDRTDGNRDSYTLSDIQIVCFQCNTTKGARSMAEFLHYCNHIALKHSERLR